MCKRCLVRISDDVQRGITQKYFETLPSIILSQMLVYRYKTLTVDIFFQFSAQVEHQRHQLHSLTDEARKKGKHVKLVRDRIYVNNCLYRPANHHHHKHNATH